MTAMTSHCTQYTTTPEIAFEHSNLVRAPRSQHLKMSRPRITILTSPHVAEVTPVRRKYDDTPSADRRRAMRYCCGMFEMMVPKITTMVQPKRASDRL
jgi:hypothetical protein